MKNDDFQIYSLYDIFESRNLSSLDIIYLSKITFFIEHHEIRVISVILYYLLIVLIKFIEYPVIY